MTYFQSGSADYEQPYYYFMFLASGLTNETWTRIAEEYGWIMEILGYNTTEENFLVMDERKALLVAELYFRFPWVLEVEGMSQKEQLENYFQPIEFYYSPELNNTNELNSANELDIMYIEDMSNLRMMYFYCGTLTDETV